MNGLRSTLAAAAVAVLALGACSGDVSSSDTTTPTSETTEVSPDATDVGTEDGAEDATDDTTAPETTLPSRDVVISVEVNPGTSEGIEGALVDVSGLACELQDGRWVVAGDVTNPLEEAVSYRIYTSFLDAQRFTRGLLESPVERVEPGETLAWSGEIGIDDVELECVLRVERLRLG